MPTSIALIAHDNQKADLVALVQKYRGTVIRYHVIATANTGKQLQAVTGIAIELVRSKQDGGDLEIVARILAGEVACVICLFDPNQTHASVPDLLTLLRVCKIHNVPLATNLATADAVLQAFSKSRVAHLIFNPVAGQGNPDWDLALIRQILEPQVHLKVIFTKPDINPGDQAKASIAAIQKRNASVPGTDFMIASGGDGTISAVANALIDTDIPLGIIPRGTANAFSVALGIPTGLKQACETILTGNTCIVDAARCNGFPMILLAGIGFEAETVERADRDMKNLLGPLAYLVAGAQQLLEQKPFTVEVEIDGAIEQFQCGAMTIANAAPPTSVLAQGLGEVIPHDGLLDVTIGIAKNENLNIADWLLAIDAIGKLFTSALVKTQIENEGLVCFRTAQIKVTANPPQKVVVDGEIIGMTPVEITCIPGGLTLFAPMSSSLSLVRTKSSVPILTQPEG
ncbi:methylglyoxal synthase [Tumidithrix elongata RA019]|uniref:Methylglyoxal synthase n=1 Tax=Tumidithrix elongata BACA0141 TaxID=2716417 RepID=A0AAW9Q4J3_9CYAN|nr:methylglyoxal synthase [Tumidithrix elongata RA019]